MPTTNASNVYCEALGIRRPDLAAAKERPDANFYSLLIVALLEKGAPLTLAEAARRFEEAGVAPAERALSSLQRCKPGRSPIYRDGDLYALDPYDDETDLWIFRLGLRPARGAGLRVVREVSGPLPGPGEALSVAQLEEAWRCGPPSDTSAQRTALCVLDAHGKPMAPDSVVGFVAARGWSSRLTVDSARYWRKGAAIRIRRDGLWEPVPDHPALRSARKAVRDRIEIERRNAQRVGDPAVIRANTKRAERRRAEHGARLASMSRALLYAFPSGCPEVVALIDVTRHEIASFIGKNAIAEMSQRLEHFDIIAAIDVRALLRRIGFEPGKRRLGELGPPQKTKVLNRSGRKLQITTALLIQGSCSIAQPFVSQEKLLTYLRAGQRGKLRRRVESEAKSLHALYQYGRTHGGVRLRWGFIDEMLPAPWIHRDEMTLYGLMAKAYELGSPVEVVLGGAPGWANPWSRARWYRVSRGQEGWGYALFDDQGYAIDAVDIQIARVPLVYDSGRSSER